MEQVQKETMLFAEKIGAKFLPLRKLKSFFEFNGVGLIIKVSRDGKEFWGIDNTLVDLELKNKKYACIFLETENRGWFCTREHFELGKGKKWKKGGDNDDYKVNGNHLEKEWYFTDIQMFLNMFYKYLDNKSIVVRHSRQARASLAGSPCAPRSRSTGRVR